MINAYNTIAIIPIERIVDYSDLIALSILPITHYTILQIDKVKGEHFACLFLSPSWLLLPASIIFMATSPPPRCYRPNGDIFIGKYYSIKMSKKKILEKIEKQGYTVLQDSSDRGDEGYILENVVLGLDTIKSIQFAVYQPDNTNSCHVYIKTVNIKGKMKLNDWRLMRKYARFYKSLINSEIIEEIKKK